MDENIGKDVPRGKPILCLDFDGVIHCYTSGWQGIDVIPDPPVPGAMAFLAEAVKHFEVHIFSSRSKSEYAISEMIAYIRKNLMEEGFPVEIADKIVFPKEKPAAFVTIDDRAITFTGKWPSMKELLNFKPWYKKNNQRESYPENWWHVTIHLNPETGEMHGDGDYRALEWIKARIKRGPNEYINNLTRAVMRANDHAKSIERSLEFYRIRIEEIAKIKHKLPEPYRTMVINILANGKPEP